MKKCEKCGIENQDNAKFCGECGHSLAENKKEASKQIKKTFEKLKTLKVDQIILNRLTSLKKQWKKISIGAIALVGVIILGTVLYEAFNNDVDKAKTYFKNNDIEALRVLKKEISREDSQQFEAFLSEESQRILTAFNNGELTAEEARVQFEKVENFSSKNTAKGELMKTFEVLEQSKEAFETGLKNKENKETLKAYESFKTVISTDVNYEQAQTYINELKPKIVDEMFEVAKTKHEAGSHTEAIEIIDEVIKLDSENTEAKTLKTEYEDAKKEAERQAEEEEKRKAEAAEAAKRLTPAKVIEKNDARFEFVKHQFSTKVLPDDISGFYSYFKSDNDEIFLDLKFKLTNTGKYGLALDDLFTNVVVEYGDGYKYYDFSCFWTDSGDLTNVYSWDELEPLKSTTYHLALNLPMGIADTTEPLKVTFKLMGEEQVLQVR